MARPAKQPKVGLSPPHGGRRGRPTPDRVAAIDAAIHAAALEVFLEFGFEGASMDAIALKAEVAKGTLYVRYEGKEPLFRAVLEDELRRWSQRAGEQDHLLPDEMGARLRHHARTLVEVFGWPEYQRIARLIDTATPALPNVARHWEEIGTRRYVRFLASDMAKAAGGADVDWDFYAKAFLFSITGWHRAETASRTVADEEITVFADRVIGMIQRAIGSE